MRFLTQKDSWLFGDFDAAIFRTKDVDIGIKKVVPSGPPDPHYHTSSTEYNLILEGSMIVNGTVCFRGDIFIFDPMEVSRCTALEDTRVLVVRFPSAPKDKVIVNDNLP